MRLLTPAFMHRLDVSMNTLIVLNALAFGLMTDSSLSYMHAALNTFCNVSIILFFIELTLRIIYYKKEFFTGPNRGWNYFDAIIVILSGLASIPFFASIRIFRIFRVFRQLNILRVIPSADRLRIIIEAIMASLPGVMWTAVLYFIVIYTYGLLGTEFFGQEFPQWFGNVWQSLFTLFQVMTLESWSMGIARPVIAVYPAAWAYFITYVVISSFVILNIVVALVLNSLTEVTERAKANEESKKSSAPALEIANSLEIIEAELKKLRALHSQSVEAESQHDEAGSAN